VPVGGVEQQTRQRKPLPRRAQSDAAQAFH